MVKFSIRAPDEQTNPTYLLHDVLVMERYGIERCGPAIIICLGGTLGATTGAVWPRLGTALAKQIG